jgi:hypothetical protein
MGQDGRHTGREEQEGQTKEILGFAHPIQIYLFEEFHAHSDPLELDTNGIGFVPKIELFLRNRPGPNPHPEQGSPSNPILNRVKPVIRTTWP